MIFEGNWIRALPAMPHETAEHASLSYRRPFATRLPAFLVSVYSTLYAKPTRRTAAAEDWAESVVWPGLDLAMLELDSVTRLHGTGLGLVYWDEPTQTAPLYAIPRHRFEVIWSDAARRMPQAIIVLYRYDRGRPVYHYWDDTWFVVLNHDLNPVAMDIGQPVTALEHGLGRIPAVLARNADVGCDGLYGVPLGGYDAVHNMMSIGRLLRELSYTAALQRGQPVFRGKPQGSMQLGPDCPIETGPDGDFTIVPNNANLDGMADIFQLLVNQFTLSSGLPPNLFSADQLSSSVSGVSLLLRRAELTMDREKRAQQFRVLEQQVATIAAGWWQVAGRGAVDPEMSITYPQIPLWRTFQERLETVKVLSGRGAMSREDALREVYPDESPEAIQKRIERADTEMMQRLVAEALAAPEGAPAPQDLAAAA
jgi:hypothetical protein